MSDHEATVEVDVPVNTAYNQWTQFESFPNFMDGVESITQTDDTHNHWKTSIAGVKEEFDTVITEQTPDQRICWETTSGTSHRGQVTFTPITPERTKVHVMMSYEPQDLKEKVGDALGFVGHQVEADLKRFKDFIETQGQETGAWRGEVN